MKSLSLPKRGEGLPFRLLLITDWSRPVIEIVKEALKAGPGIAVQHRHPGASDRQFYEEGLRLKEVCAEAPLFINGRLDVALALDAHLHLTERSLKASEVRPFLKERYLSAAWHPGRPSDLPHTEIEFFLVSPVFDPISKAAEGPALGVDGFQAFARSVELPCFALGGITAKRVPLLGPVAGVAVIGEVMHAHSPAHSAQALLRALE